MDHAGPPALEWKPLLDSLRPTRGDPLCQGFSGKTWVYSVCSQSWERPGRGGRPCSSQVTSACFPLHSRPPPSWPLLGAPPETPTLQPCFPSAPTPISAVVLTAVCCPRAQAPPSTRARSSPGPGRCQRNNGVRPDCSHLLRPHFLWPPLEGRGRPGQGPFLSPSSPHPLVPSVLPSLLCLTTSLFLRRFPGGSASRPMLHPQAASARASGHTSGGASVLPSADRQAPPERRAHQCCAGAHAGAPCAVSPGIPGSVPEGGQGGRPTQTLTARLP